MNGAFDSDECKLLAEALDRAWAKFLRAGSLTTANNDVAKAALAYALLDAAASGEQNVRRLAVLALAFMGNHEDKIRDQRFFISGEHQAFT